MHHARNPKYIDRNHAGIFIIWDRMFGTYRKEEEEPTYGITTPLASWNPVWANFANWVDLFKKARKTTRLGDRVRLFLKPPGWHPEELGGYVAAPEVDPAYRKYETPVPTGLALYILVQFLVVLGATAVFLFRFADLGPTLRVGGTALVVLSVVSLGGLFERKTWAFVLEGLRVAGLGAFALFSGWIAPWGAGLAGALLALAMLVWLLQYRGLTGAPASPHPAR